MPLYNVSTNDNLLITDATSFTCSRVAQIYDYVNGLDSMIQMKVLNSNAQAMRDNVVYIQGAIRIRVDTGIYI